MMQRFRLPQTSVALLVLLVLGLAVAIFAVASCAEIGDAPFDDPGDQLSIDQERPGMLAGVSVVDTTPAVGISLAGYDEVGTRKEEFKSFEHSLDLILHGACKDQFPNHSAAIFKPSEGVKDPLSARALVLSNGVVKMAILKVDALWLTDKFHREMVSAAAAIGIDSENLIVGATHTHSGPGGIDHRRPLAAFVMDCFHEATYATMVARMKQALVEANQDMQPARLAIGSTRQLQQVSFNRRIRASSLDGPRDDTLGLIKVETIAGEPLAAIINFGIHGTLFGPSNRELSADVMGFVERGLESRLGTGVAMFLNGAEGDINPIHELGGEAIAESLAATALGLWQQLPSKAWVEIAGSKDMVSVGAASLHPSACNSGLGAFRFLCGLVNPIVNVAVGGYLTTAYPFAALRIDDYVLAMVPGEPTTAIAAAIKREGAGAGFEAKTMVVSLANDHMSYITTESEYDLANSLPDQYEAVSTFFGRETGAKVRDALGEAIRKVSTWIFSATMGEGLGAPQHSNCPEGSVMMGVTGKGGGAMDSIRARCVRLTLGSDNRYRRSSAAVDASTSLGGSGGNAFAWSCPNDEIAYGANVYVRGSHFNGGKAAPVAMELHCGTLARSAQGLAVLTHARTSPRLGAPISCGFLGLGCNTGSRQVFKCEEGRAMQGFGGRNSGVVGAMRLACGPEPTN